MSAVGFTTKETEMPYGFIFVFILGVYFMLKKKTMPMTLLAGGTSKTYAS